MRDAKSPCHQHRCVKFQVRVVHLYRQCAPSGSECCGHSRAQDLQTRLRVLLQQLMHLHDAMLGLAFQGQVQQQRLQLLSATRTSH